LAESELLSSYEVFYCPSNTRWINKNDYISRIKPGTSENWFVNYSYWAGYKRAVAVDENIVSSRYSDSDALFMSDKLGINGSSYNYSNHISNDKAAGSNVTKNDGVVKWRSYSTMTYRFTHHFDFWW